MFENFRILTCKPKQITYEKLFLFALIAVAAISGCKKDDDKPSYNGDVTINGVKTSFTQMKFFDVTVNTSTSYDISNYDSETKTLSISLSNPIVGDNNFGAYNYVDIEVNSKSYSSKSGAGKITLTEKSEKTLKGTFSGTFTDDDTNAEIQITGSFNSTQITLADLQ